MSVTLKNDSDFEASGVPAPLRADVRQRRRMLVALAVLLAAVMVVLIKDRGSWLSSSADTENSIQNAATASPGPAPQVPAAQTDTPAETPLASRTRAAAKLSAAKSDAPPAPMISATDRTVLPPLEIEVVAGNQHQALPASSPSVKVDMQPRSAGAAQASAPAPTQQEAGSDAHVTLPPGITERVTRPVQPNYPLLAKQMKVQGAVVLQALIDKAGNIEDLHVVSGPTILAAAAREAVKQWHFKPYFQSGEPVETEARITVNFTISTY